MGNTGQCYSFSYQLSFLAYFYAEIISYCILKEYVLQSKFLFM